MLETGLPSFTGARVRVQTEAWARGMFDRLTFTRCHLWVGGPLGVSRAGLFVGALGAIHS